MAAASYDRGFADGKREAARLLLDTLADNAATLSGRLTDLPDAVSAINEATAILRDAARALDFDPATTRTQAEPAAGKGKRARAGGTVEVERPKVGDPNQLTMQEATDDE